MTGDSVDLEAASEAARRIIGQHANYRPTSSHGINGEALLADAALVADALEQRTQELAEARAEVERLDSWQGFLELLNRKYPADIFDGSSGDPGPLLIVQVRRAESAEATLEELRKAAQRVVDGKMLHPTAFYGDEDWNDALDALSALLQRNRTEGTDQD